MKNGCTSSAHPSTQFKGASLQGDVEKGVFVICSFMLAFIIVMWHYMYVYCLGHQ